MILQKFAAQETFIISINVKNSCGASYCCGNQLFNYLGFKRKELV